MIIYYLRVLSFPWVTGILKIARKRIALSVDPEYHELLTKLAEHQNKTVTTVVTDFLEASKPMAIAMNQAFEDLKVGKDLADVQQKLFAEGLKAASEQLNKD